MKVKKATALDLVASFVGLLLVIALVETRPPISPSLFLLEGLLAAAAVALTFLVYRRVG